MTNKNIEFVDVEPLIIEYGEEGKWIHPYITTWYTPDTESTYDDNMYRMYFYNADGATIYIFFKSDYLDKKVDAWMSTGNIDSDDESEWPNTSTLFKSPFVDSAAVATSLHLILTEDFWIPSPNIDVDINNSKDYEKFRESNQADQFCFTEFGKKIGSYFEHDYKMDFFSLDCGLTTDGTDWWCDS